MNYRHIYHAGNHTEVFKHAALISLMIWLRRKQTPFMVLDTHAGLGLYDLQSPESLKTREADDGIRSIVNKQLCEAEAYKAFVQPFIEANQYPGSPTIIGAHLREQDRLAACELHPTDAQILRANFRTHRNVAVHARDGYEALLALIPPPERRGLVFIDPPFENRDEAAKLGRKLVAAVRKWPSGCFAVWYPYKTPEIGDSIAKALRTHAVPNCLRAEFLRFPDDGIRLAGSGLFVINPPWQFDEVLRRLGGELLRAFEAGDGRATVEWLARPS